MSMEGGWRKGFECRESYTFSLSIVNSSRLAETFAAARLNPSAFAMYEAASRFNDLQRLLHSAAQPKPHLGDAVSRIGEMDRL